MEHEPDYLELWRELAMRGRHHFASRFDRKDRAEAYDAASKRKNEARPDQLLEFVKQQLRPEDSVIDIGAGTGRWTVPIANVVSRVTAVDPSSHMLALLNRNAEQAGVSSKITTVQAAWETAAVECHDVAICFHAMYMSTDFAAFIRKMEGCARRTCYLGLRHFPIDGIIQELCTTIYGTRHDSPNFVVGYNALYQMGIYANVLVEDFRQNWTDTSLDEAFARAKRHLRLEETTEHDSLIRSTLKRRLVLKNAVYEWPDGMSTAMVWWKVRSQASSPSGTGFQRNP